MSHSLPHTQKLKQTYNVLNKSKLWAPSIQALIYWKLLFKRLCPSEGRTISEKTFVDRYFDIRRDIMHIKRDQIPSICIKSLIPSSLWHIVC